MFKNPFSFDGRIRRLEYGLSFIIYLVAYFLVIALTASGNGAGLIAMLMLIPMLWFLWAQNAKRCHDLGRSGWWQLIPFYGFVMLFVDGDEGRNEYGLSPKYPEEAGDVLSSETLDAHLRN
jgi:uncharacterized membrane protein YhaH (DUF805 family)